MGVMLVNPEKISLRERKELGQGVLSIGLISPGRPRAAIAGYKIDGGAAVSFPDAEKEGGFENELLPGRALEELHQRGAVLV